MDTPTQESSGSSTRPRRQLLTSRQAQDLLSTVLDGEISDNSVVEEPSTISDEEFEGSSLSSRSRSNTSSSERDERPLIPAKRSKPSTTKGTNRRRSNPRSTATESVVTGGGDAPNATIDANDWTQAADGKEVGGSRFRNLNSGSQLDLGEEATPYEFFNSLVTDEILDDLVSYINSYAGVFLQKNNPLKKHSRLHQWDPITRSDFLKFLAILISIGIDHRPKISDYWSTKSYMYTPWYSKQMSRNIFQLILHTVLHASEPNTEGKAKIEPFVHTIVAQFQRCFYPYEALSLDEMVIGFKGRFAHKQFNAAKPHKYHIKTFGLCDAVTGYVVNLLIYFGLH